MDICITCKKNKDMEGAVICRECDERDLLERTETVSHAERGMFMHRGVRRVILTEGIREIEYAMFQAATLLEDVVMPRGLETIWSLAFYYCKALRRVSFPDTLREIWNSSFEKSAVESISLPSSMELIYDSAFRECEELVSFSLADGNRAKLGKRAFESCKKLRSARIGSGATKIGTEAFSGCSELREVYLPNTLTSLGSSLFRGCREGLKILFDGTAPEWVKLAMPEEVTATSTVLGAYDRYPYYYDNGTTEYRTYKYTSYFDSGIDRIEVFCEKDGRTLVYGESMRKA